MTPEEIADLTHLRRARDLMDRDFEVVPPCVSKVGTRPQRTTLTV